MARVTPDEGRGRRLPKWMLGVNPPDEVKRSNNGNEKSCLGKVLTSQACQPKEEAETQKPEKAALLGESSASLPKCETKRTKRKSNMQDMDHDEVITTVAKKRKYNKTRRKVLETASSERKTAKRLRTERKKELDISSPSDDDVELTVEDLIRIAEEYVQDDKEMQQQRSTSIACESEHLSMTTSSRIGLGDSLDPPSNHASCCSTVTLFSERAVTNASITGDPTKDMLDLLLGPLLKKPLEQEKKAEFKSIDYAFSYDLKNEHLIDTVGEERVPLMNKKSSLRDKIAMFLD